MSEVIVRHVSMPYVAVNCALTRHDLVRCDSEGVYRSTNITFICDVKAGIVRSA
jgi:hypothetical protein